MGGFGEQQTSTKTVAPSSTGTVTVSGAVFSADDIFTNRDLTQTADTSSAKTISLTSNQDVTISEEGVYVVSGSATNATIVVDADSSAKVQIVLNGITITNDSAPAIYVKSADKVFVTLSGSNTLSVTGTFTSDGDTNTDAVIFSKDDLVLNGTGSLTVKSTDNAVTSKDDLRITGGTYDITCTGHAFECNDTLAVSDGTFTIDAGKDGFNCDNDEDGTLGNVYVSGGTFNITAASDGIHASAVAQVDGGNLTIAAPEGIEATYLQINDGTIAVSSTDDGLNATNMSAAYETTIEITGGKLTVAMSAGDTDGLDSNGNLYLTGGTIDITGNSPFDYDGQGVLSGATVTVNGQQVTQLSSQMMGGGMGNMGSMGSMGSMGGRGRNM